MGMGSSAVRSSPLCFLTQPLARRFLFIFWVQQIQLINLVVSICVLPLPWWQGDEPEADTGEAWPEGPEWEPGCHSWPGTHDPGVQETLQGQWSEVLKLTLRSDEAKPWLLKLNEEMGTRLVYFLTSSVDFEGVLMTENKSYTHVATPCRRRRALRPCVCIVNKHSPSYIIRWSTSCCRLFKRCCDYIKWMHWPASCLFCLTHTQLSLCWCCFKPFLRTCAAKRSILNNPAKIIIPQILSSEGNLSRNVLYSWPPLWRAALNAKRPHHSSMY